MKKLILVILLLSGCTLTAQDPVAQQALNQHAIIINAISNYIADLQNKGVLPKPTPVPTEVKK